ncbi:MAG: cyclic nucleotide-binding domain-containing protein, partial [Burkholderiales bacterium]
MSSSDRKVIAPELKLLGSGSKFQTRLLAMLQGSQFFSDFPPAEIETLTQYVQAYSVVPGTVIFREGDRGGFMCMVIEGSAEIFKQDNKYSSKRIGQIEPGKTIGEMALVDGEQRSATCICPQQSTLVMLTREQFVRIIREHPPLSVNILLKIVTMMSRRLRQT